MSSVIAHAFGGGQNHNQTEGFPSALFGPPEANNPTSVVSLGNGGWVVLAFGPATIIDDSGPDFVVFENPLPGFAELATVEVSHDGVIWIEFPCTAAQNASDYGSCAGVAPVYSNSKNGKDPLDPSESGGDLFDLADVGLPSARFVRITDRVDLTGNAGVFDLDAVGILHASCEP